MELDVLSNGIVRMVNLVAFDVCDTTSLTYTRDADPLKVTASWRIIAPISPQLFTPIRKAVREQVITAGALPGKIVLDGRLAVTIYLKTLRGPAYVEGVSPKSAT